MTGLLTFVETFFNSKSNGFYATNVNKVLKATKQLVAGMLYKLNVQLKLSCKQQQQQQNQQKQQQCSDDTYETVDCSIEVLSRSWMNPATVINKFHCGNVTTVASDNLYNDKDDTTLYFRRRNHDKVDVESLLKMNKDSAFSLFKRKYNKVYDTNTEERKRFQIFQDNLKLMKYYQSHDAGSAIYGASVFADLTEKEFREKYLSKEWNLNGRESVNQVDTPLFESELPQQFDWREHGAVTPVKNQGMCGSCWAFSVTGNVEGQWFLKKNQSVSVSEQQLVDCDKLDEGCNGGLPSLAYLEIIRMGGLEQEVDYPYKGRDGACTFDGNKPLVYINSSLNISQDETVMASWLYKNGPMSIGINAMFMQFYLGGISHPWHILCPTALDHGVLIVGYAVKKGIFRDTPYWIIKNSWGPHWGEKGYYLVYRGDGTCGLNLLVSSAVVL